MNVPGLPNLPAPSPNMRDNWRNTGNHLDNSWRYQVYEPPPIEPIRPINPILPLRDEIDMYPYRDLDRGSLW